MLCPLLWRYAVCAVLRRAVGKGNSNAMKAAGLKLAAAVVQGLPQTDRNMATVQAEAWRLFEKQVKVGDPTQACDVPLQQQC